MSDDYSADRFTTGAVEVGGSATGTIETAYDEDWFAVELVAGRTYQFDLEGSPTGRGTLPDTYLRAIYNSQGRYQSGTYNDNFDGSRNSRVTFTPDADGRYYVRVSGDRDEIGSYTLSVRDETPPEAGTPPPADPPAETAAAASESETDQGQAVPRSVSEGTTDLPSDASTPGRVAVGDTATGRIGSSGDRDWFAVELVAGRTYVIDLRGSPTGDGTLSDPYLRGIYDADGNRISNTTDDDGGQSYNSRVTFTATESGTHYIAAGAYSSRQGTYEVEVTDTSPPVVGPDVDSGDSPDSQEQVQEQPPAFGSQFYGFELEENADGSANRLSLGTVSATDPDGGSVSYSIAGGNESGRFEIDAASGELFYVGGGEDYETGATSFNLTVRASDGDQTTDATVTVNVTDVAEAPAFAQAVYAFDLAENADGSANRLSLGTVSATDPDGGSVTYSIEGGNESGRFELDAASGELFYVGGGEDYETGATSFELTVRASDGDQPTDTTVTVDVTDMDEPVAVDPPVTQEVQSVPQTVSEGTTDLPNDNTTPGRVAVGGSATGRIGSSGDRDWFAVELVAGRTYVINLRGSPTGDGTLRDPFLRGIYDAEGNRISNTADDDGGQGYNSRVTFTATESGTHYIAAGAYSGQGTYEVEVTDTSPPIVGPDPDSEDPPASQEQVQSTPQTVSEPAGTDFPADDSTAGRIAVDDSVTGTVGTAGDEDWFAVELVAGKPYRFLIEPLHDADDPLEFPKVHLRSPAGEVLESGGLSVSYPSVTGSSRVYFFSEFDFIATETGTHYAAVSTLWGVSRTGAYDLSVSEIPDDYADSPATSGSVDVEGSETGEIDFRGDHDWFAVDLQADRTYRLDLEGSVTGAGTLGDPHLRGIFDSDGTPLPDTTDGNGGAGSNSRLTFTPTEAGTYYVAAGGSGNYYNTGTYRLSVIDVTDGVPDDYSADENTSGRVAVGGSTEGLVEYRDDVDWFAVTLEGGTNYQIDVKGDSWDDSGGTLGDPYLYGIHDAGGNFLPGTKVNDGGYGGNSRLWFKPDTGGTYYVAAGAHYRERWGYARDEGSYTVAVTDLTPGAGLVAAAAVGRPATGSIDFEYERDWFGVTLEAGTTYQFDLKGFVPPHGDPEGQHHGGSLRDPWILGIYDAARNEIPGTGNNNGGYHYNSRVTFTPTEDGDYYLMAGAYGRYLFGTYTLLVDEVDTM